MVQYSTVHYTVQLYYTVLQSPVPCTHSPVQYSTVHNTVQYTILYTILYSTILYSSHLSIVLHVLFHLPHCNWFQDQLVLMVKDTTTESAHAHISRAFRAVVMT